MQNLTLLKQFLREIGLKCTGWVTRGPHRRRGQGGSGRSLWNGIGTGQIPRRAWGARSGRQVLSRGRHLQRSHFDGGVFVGGGRGGGGRGGGRRGGRGVVVIGGVAHFGVDQHNRRETSFDQDMTQKNAKNKRNQLSGKRISGGDFLTRQSDKTGDIRAGANGKQQKVKAVSGNRTSRSP